VQELIWALFHTVEMYNVRIDPTIDTTILVRTSSHVAKAISQSRFDQCADSRRVMGGTITTIGCGFHFGERHRRMRQRMALVGLVNLEEILTL